MRKQSAICNLQSAIAAALILLIAAPSFASQTVHRYLEPETVVYDGVSSAAQTQFATNENIKAVKYGSGVTLAAVTAKFSLVDGTAFVTNPSVDLRPYIGFKLTTNDGSVGYARAAGTSETLSAEKITASDDRTFASDTGFWNKGVNWSIGSGVATAANSSAYFYRASLGTVGWLCEVVGTYTVTGGAITLVFGAAEPAVAAGVGRVDYGTFSSNGNFGWKATSGTSGTLDNVSLKQVLTPSVNGVTIVSTAGGTTYNWTAKGTTPNAASFTFTVTRN